MNEDEEKKEEQKYMSQNVSKKTIFPQFLSNLFQIGFGVFRKDFKFYGILYTPARLYTLPSYMEEEEKI